MSELPALNIGVSVFDRAPGQHGYRAGHREPELGVIAGIEPSAAQIYANGAAVMRRRIAAPIDPVKIGQDSRLLLFIEVNSFLQRFPVIEHWALRFGCGCPLRAGDEDGRQKNGQSQRPSAPWSSARPACESPAKTD